MSPLESSASPAARLSPPLSRGAVSSSSSARLRRLYFSPFSSSSFGGATGSDFTGSTVSLLFRFLFRV